MAKDILSEYARFLHTSQDIKPEEQVKTIDIVSWGLSHIIGLSGFPVEHIIEVFGPPKVGKTTLVNYIISRAQRHLKKPVLYIDVEGKYMLQYAKTCGVNIAPEWFKIAQSEQSKENAKKAEELELYGEYALKMMVEAVRSKKFSAVVLDSIGGLTMRAIFEGEVSDAHVGLESRFITKFVKQLNIVRKGSGTVIIAINQIRSKIGAYNPETTPGGWAFEHHASLRLRVGRGDAIEYKGKKIGYYLNVVCKNNNFSEPFREAKIPLIYYKGIYPPMELLLTAKELGLVEQRGAFYSLGDVRLGSGMVESSKMIMQYAKELTPKIKKLLLEEERKGRLTVID